MKKSILILIGVLALLLVAGAGVLSSCSADLADRPLPAGVDNVLLNGTKGPAYTDECVWRGVVYDRRQEGCGFVIQLEDEYQTVLVPVTLPGEFRLFEGQLVAVGYNVHGNQNSTCMAGVLAEIFCIRQTGIDRGIFNDRAPSDDKLAD